MSFIDSSFRGVAALVATSQLQRNYNAQRRDVSFNNVAWNLVFTGRAVQAPGCRPPALQPGRCWCRFGLEKIAVHTDDGCANRATILDPL
ncbi:hypothetical protein JHW44_02370 [Paracoccus seriniphilus]|nr:hypothetical protein JHW44_02370 [Paracoccus seriniphilus]